MSNQNLKDIYEDKNNDRYPEDLQLLNKRKNEWYMKHPKQNFYRMASYAVLLIGCVCIGLVYSMNKDASTTLETLPLHAAIWVTALATYLVARAGKKVYQKPFGGLHAAHFEAGPKGLYYIYQQGMSLNTYYIKDKDLREIIRDDEANCLYIKGKGTLQVQSRKDRTQHSIDGIYAMVGVDEYDLDDLLEPYAEYVTEAPGTLRDKYLDEGSEQ